ncbi:MAG: hypothetical protein JRF72_19020 [Deltaproteobacteria bacterium]|jgi:hypothetical protein|nr:hypothetical protein [Deltaproteobacteria bacterium]
MGRKRKKQKEKEGFKPETAKDPIDVDSPEVVEAVEQFNTEQSEAIADLMDDAPDEGLPDPDRTKLSDDDKADEKTSDDTKAMSQEQESQPEAKEHAEKSEAKAEEQPPADMTEEADADVPESEPEPEPEKPTKEPQYLSGEKFADYTVEVVSEDGARPVSLSNLVTTYQKYPETQRKYAELKPIRDLAKKAQVEINQVVPLLELGIQTYARQQGIMDGTQPPVADTGQGAPLYQPGQGGYPGPFKDAETDAYYKEADPELYASVTNSHRIAQNAISRIQQLETHIQQAKSAPAPQPSGPSEEEVQRAFDDKIMGWAGKNDYFTAPNIGEVRLSGFKNFLIKNHAGKGMKLADLTPDFLASEFVRFDPKYNLEFAKGLNQKKAQAAKNDSGMFAEGSDVRSKAVPLDEQQSHMADMF